jgi:hypothetical protein
MSDFFVLFVSMLLLHLPCILAVGACGLGCKICGVRHRTKFVTAALLIIGLYTGAHYYEHLEGDPKGSPNYFFCGN